MELASGSLEGSSVCHCYDCGPFEADSVEPTSYGQRFLEAGLLSRPHRRIVKHIWSVAAVLDTPMLREWVPAQDLGRPKLSWRATLLALASARRARGLSLVHIDGNHMFRRRDSWRFILAFRMKQDHHLDIFHLLW